MDAKVCASAASLATAATPADAAAIAARTVPGCRVERSAAPCAGRNRLRSGGCTGRACRGFRRALDPADTVRIVAPASPRIPPVRAGDIRHGRASVVLGIISFTRWPTTPVRLHASRAGPTCARLTDTLQAGSTLLDVQRVRFDDPALGIACDIVYLGNGRRGTRAWGSGGRPSGADNFGKRSIRTAGGMFCLNVDGERVSFDINLDAVARSGVRVHPNVLNLARRPGAP